MYVFFAYIQSFIEVVDILELALALKMMLPTEKMWSTLNISSMREA